MNENEKKFAIILGERIRGYRKSLSLTIEELAERCVPPVHYNYLGAVERGEYNLSVSGLIRIAKGLNIPIEILLKDIEEPEKQQDEKALKINTITALLQEFDENKIEFIQKVVDEVRRKF